MSGGLMLSGDGGGPVARCTRCGAEAAGPCARCRAPVCGDCCVLTDGGVQVWAICFACNDRGGRSLRRGWVVVLSWVLVPIAALAIIVWLLEMLVGR